MKNLKIMKQLEEKIKNIRTLRQYFHYYGLRKR